MYRCYSILTEGSDCKIHLRLGSQPLTIPLYMMKSEVLNYHTWVYGVNNTANMAFTCRQNIIYE